MLLNFLDQVQEASFETQETMPGVSGDFFQRSGVSWCLGLIQLGQQDRLMGPMESSLWPKLSWLVTIMPHNGDSILDFQLAPGIAGARLDDRSQVRLVNGIKENLAHYGRLKLALEIHLKFHLEQK